MSSSGISREPWGAVSGCQTRRSPSRRSCRHRDAPLCECARGRPSCPAGWMPSDNIGRSKALFLCGCARAYAAGHNAESLWGRRYTDTAAPLCARTWCAIVALKMYHFFYFFNGHLKPLHCTRSKNRKPSLTWSCVEGSGAELADVGLLAGVRPPVLRHVALLHEGLFA